MHSCNIIIFIALIAGFDGASGWILDSRVRIWSAFREIPLLPRNAACYSHPVIAMDRQITPGDYVVHPSYGVGQFTGTLSYSSGTNGVHGSMLSVHYKDGELLVKDDDAKKSLFFVQANSMCHVHSLLDARTWRKKSANLDKSVENHAKDAVKTIISRKSVFRLPYEVNAQRFNEFERGFMFAPTEDQQKCFDAVKTAMCERSYPMDMLICGDAGFGKTEIALRAAYRAALSKKQTVILVPTKVLSEQIYSVLTSRMPDIRAALLTGSTQNFNRRDIIDDIKSGKCQVVVATHAILQKNVRFFDLGLIIIDEEQRLGVIQKNTLLMHAPRADVLTMTATPIPRTLYLSLVGLKDLSYLNSPPPSRKSSNISIEIFNWDRIKFCMEQELKRNGQVLVVAPHIKLAVDFLQQFKNITNFIPSVIIDFAHGQMNNCSEVIQRFREKKSNVLVATTVVEVGLDMPDVNTIIVIGAERFGVSTLYQLKGRVGRSDQQAYAFFFVTSEESMTNATMFRMELIKKFNGLGCGAKLAEGDLQNRGFGTMFGKFQSGKIEEGQDFYFDILKQKMRLIEKQLIFPADNIQLRLNDSISDLFYIKSSVKGSNIEELFTERAFDLEDWALEELLNTNCMASPQMSKILWEISSCDDVNTLKRLWFDADQICCFEKKDVLASAIYRRAIRLLGRKLGILEINQKSPSRFHLKFGDTMNADLWLRYFQPMSHNDSNVEITFTPTDKIAILNFQSLNLQHDEWIPSPSSIQQKLIEVLMEMNRLATTVSNKILE